MRKDQPDIELARLVEDDRDLREALRLLEADGLVTTVPHRGPVVSTISLEEAKQLYAARAVLEGFAGRDDFLNFPGAVEAIVAGLPASFPDPREQVVYEVAMALAGGRLVPQGLYDRAVTVLGHETVTDMVVLMGDYTAVALTMIC